MIKERRVEELRKDGTLGVVILQEEEEGTAVDLAVLDEARTVAEGDEDLAELQGLLGDIGKADAQRRAVRFALEQKKGK